jgi:hypothetical protein
MASERMLKVIATMFEERGRINKPLGYRLPLLVGGISF